MPLAETASPLDGLASAASVLLVFELFFIVVLVAVVLVLLALGMAWLHNHVIPLLQEYVPTVRGALNATDRASGQVIDVVANLYAWRKGFEEGVLSFLRSLVPIFGALFSDRPLPGTTPADDHTATATMPPGGAAGPAE
jgi:hypothetical protein